MTKTYLIRLWKNNSAFVEFETTFNGEKQMKQFVENYFDGGDDNVVIEVINRKDNIYHKYENLIGTHNQLKLYDNI